MLLNRATPLLAFALLLITSVATAATKIEITTASSAGDHATGEYAPGETITWLVKVTTDDQPAVGKIDYVVQRSGLEVIAKESIDLVDGKASITATRDNPGTLLLAVTWNGEKEKLTRYCGAAIAWPKIAPSTDKPADFDAFWKSKVEELAKTDANPQLTPVDVGDDSIEYYHITLGGYQGTTIHGQLAKPKGKTDLPALLQVQWAGVYPLQKDWILHLARSGWLVLNISAHDLPVNEKPEFYAEQAKNQLNDYPGIGNDDREKSYFLRMFLSCYRAADYMTTRDDWNHHTLLVQGGSQGGYQAIVTAGFHPAVTAMAANVPAGCDHTGKQAGRAPGWPNWASRTWQGKSEEKMLAAAPYFDAMHFARNVKCDAVVGVALGDTACPSEGVLATCALLGGSKEIVLMPSADHGGDHAKYNQAHGKFLEKHRTSKGK